MSGHCIRFVSVTHAASILGVVFATSTEAMTIAARPAKLPNTVPRHVWIVVIQINNSNLMYSCTSSQSQAQRAAGTPIGTGGAGGGAGIIVRTARGCFLGSEANAGWVRPLSVSLLCLLPS